MCVSGVKKLLRIPSGPQAAGVSISTVQAEVLYNGLSFSSTAFRFSY